MGTNQLLGWVLTMVETWEYVGQTAMGMLKVLQVVVSVGLDGWFYLVLQLSEFVPAYVAD